MAHHLSFVNGRAEMAFVGDTPWHKFGERIEKGSSIETMRHAAHMDWDAVKVPLSYRHPRTGHFTKLEGLCAIARSDTGQILGHVSENYKIHSMSECFEFFRDVIDDGTGWYISTAGVLHGGSKIWAMATRENSDLIVPGDRVTENLTLVTSFDGSHRTAAFLSVIRTVCQNTVNAGLSSAGLLKPGGKIKSSVEARANGSKLGATISHRSDFDADALKRELSGASDAYGFFVKSAQKMAETTIDDETALRICRAILGEPVNQRGRPRKDAAPVQAQQETQQTEQTENEGNNVLVNDGSDFAALMMKKTGGADLSPTERMKVENKAVEAALKLWKGEGMGAQADGVRGTAWGLLNGITEYFDHHAGRDRNNALDSAFFGQAAGKKIEAFQMLAAGAEAGSFEELLSK